MVELSKLKLIAQGGQADIYELDQDKVIRVLRNKDEEKNLKTEMSVMNSLKEKGKAVPKVYEYVTIEGRPSLIMERLSGDSMLTEMKRKPLKLLKQAEKLAKLHIEVAGSAEDLRMISINDRAASLIPGAELLDCEQKDFIMNILAELPRGNDICHGDFHPGNIMIAGNQYFVIDWFGATLGEKLSDIAHSYLLMRNMPKMPGEDDHQSYMLKCICNIISRKYLSTWRKFYSFDWGNFSKWLIVRAAERLCYGMPSEKERLVEFIDQCRRAQKHGVEVSRWWKFI